MKKQKETRVDEKKWSEEVSKLLSAQELSVELPPKVVGDFKVPVLLLQNDVDQRGEVYGCGNQFCG